MVEPEKVSRSVQVLMEKARQEAGRDIDSVFVNINGAHIFSTNSRGMVAVSRADQKISEEDVGRVLQAAQTVALSSNKEILDIFPKEFIVDGEGGLKEVTGMQGGRLEAEVLALGVFSPYKNNLTQAVLGSKNHILNIFPGVLASAAATITPQQQELGVAVLDIGSGTSELAVFEEGDLVHLNILPVGSSNITNDIAVGLKTELDIAEDLKTKEGTCLFKGKGKKEKVETDEEEPLVFSQKQLNKIIEIRISQILKEVQKELKSLPSQGNLPAGVILTGGGAKLPRIAELAKKELKLPCRVGKPFAFSGLEEDPEFAAACGLILKAAEWEGENKGEKIETLGKGAKGAVEKVKNFFKIFLP